MKRLSCLLAVAAIALPSASSWSQTTWIEETFDSAVVDTTLVLGDSEPTNLNADNVWNPTTSFESAPGTDGPEVKIVSQGSGDNALSQESSGDGVGDLISPALSVVDFRENDITIQFEATTGANPGAQKRTTYIYVGRSAGEQYGIRAKLEQEGGKLEIEATVLPSAPGGAGEAEEDFSLEAGDAIPGGGVLAAGFQHNATFQVTLTYSSAGNNATLATCTVFDVTNNRLLKDAETKSIAGGLTGDRNLFDAAIISFKDEAPGLQFDNLLVEFEAAGASEGETEGAGEGAVEGEEEGSPGTGEDPEDVFTFWFEETFTGATLGTTRVMTDGAATLSADNVWQPASSFEEAPGTDGPTVAIVNGADGLAISQLTQGDGKGDLISPVLTTFDALESKLSITLEVTTGAAPADARKMYVYAGRAAGSQYGYRAKVEQKSDELVIEATLLPEAPSDNNEAEVAFSLADGAAFPGGTLEAGFANNATFRINIVFDADPDDFVTEVECTVEDLTNDRILRDEDEDVIPIFLDAPRAQFDSVVLTFADDEPGLLVDNLSLAYEVGCDVCDEPQSFYYRPGESACLSVPDSFGQNDAYEWSKVGEGVLREGRYNGVNCRTLQIPILTGSDSGTYQCSFGAGKAVYSTTIVVTNTLPASGMLGLGALAALITAVAARRARRE